MTGSGRRDTSAKQDGRKPVLLYGIRKRKNFAFSAGEFVT